MADIKEKKTILVATIKQVHVNNFKRLAQRFPEKRFFLITGKEDLTIEKISGVKPDIIFFPHWSWMIEGEIINGYECIIFHTSDLPYGRGGSPLQNQIIRKMYKSKVCAVRANATIDGGDVYCRRDVFLGLGSIDEILRVVSNTIFDELIPYILENDFTPEKQIGTSIEFRRRKKSDSNLTGAGIVSLPNLFDFIRMLDGEGYPKAFIELQNIIIEFSEAHLKNGLVTGRFEAYEKENIDDSGASRR